MTITGLDADISSPPTVTFTFNEPVTGFGPGDIELLSIYGNEGAAVEDFVAVSSTVYTARIVPPAPRTLRIRVPANSVTDAVGHPNVITYSSLTWYRDTGNVSVTVGAVPSLTKDAFTATFTFSEPVSGFTLDDIALENGIASHFEGSGATYSARITPVQEGEFKVSVPAGAASDEDLEPTPNNASTEVTGVYDPTRPTVEISGVLPETPRSFTVQATFSEKVQGMDLEDFAVVNGTVSNFPGRRRRVDLQCGGDPDNGRSSVRDFFGCRRGPGSGRQRQHSRRDPDRHGG